MSGRLTVNPKLKVLDTIVGLVSVDVVNILIRGKWATQLLLHHKPMLLDILTIHPEAYVSVGVDPSVYPWARNLDRSQ